MQREKKLFTQILGQELQSYSICYSWSIIHPHFLTSHMWPLILDVTTSYQLDKQDSVGIKLSRIQIKKLRLKLQKR